MSLVQLRLPETLHHQLQEQAEREGLALDQYILYALTRLVSAVDLAAQKLQFQKLTSRYPAEEAEAALQQMLAARAAE